MSNSVHDGHRKRVRAEILEGNFNSKTAPHRVLEALLFYSIPRGDTNELAHRLIDRFGSFDCGKVANAVVLDADLNVKDVFFRGQRVEL